MSGPDDVIIAHHLFTSICRAYHCHQHHYQHHHNHHHHDHPHLLKHADLVVDHEEGLGGDQLLDSVEILLKLRSRLYLDVPESEVQWKNVTREVIFKYYAICQGSFSLSTIYINHTDCWWYLDLLMR